MLTRRFGRTEIEIPLFSCGGMRYQYKWVDRPLREVPVDNQTNLRHTIERAIELGINHIETARGYGSSERQLGPVLKRFDRRQLIVQTKVAPNADPAVFEQQFLESLERLQVDYVDLFAIHGVNNREKLDWTLAAGGCFDVAQRLRREGKCRFVGFSTHGPLDVVVDAISHGEARVGAGFDYVNLHWYFIRQHDWGAVHAARQRDMGVFIISPTDKGGKLHQPTPFWREACAPLSPIVFNDLFCLARPEVHTLSIGAARPSDFDEHLRVLPLLQDAERHLAAPEARLAARMHERTGFRHPEELALTLPRWEELPDGINLQTINWLYQLAVGWDMVPFARARYNLLNAGDDWFPGSRPDRVDSSLIQRLRHALGAHPQAERVLDDLVAAAKLLAGEDRKRESAGS